MLIAALVAVVPLAGMVMLPVYVAVGFAQVIEKLYVPGAPVAGAPVTFLVIVTATLLRVNGLVTPTVALANRGVAIVPPVTTGVPHV